MSATERRRNASTMKSRASSALSLVSLLTPCGWLTGQNARAKPQHPGNASDAESKRTESSFFDMRGFSVSDDAGCFQRAC